MARHFGVAEGCKLRDEGDFPDKIPPWRPMTLQELIRSQINNSSSEGWYNKPVGKPDTPELQ
jgi:hypothetical protein